MFLPQRLWPAILNRLKLGQRSSVVRNKAKLSAVNFLTDPYERQLDSMFSQCNQIELVKVSKQAKVSPGAESQQRHVSQPSNSNSYRQHHRNEAAKEKSEGHLHSGSRLRLSSLKGKPWSAFADAFGCESSKGNVKSVKLNNFTEF